MMCNLCPRKCGVDREKQKGYCGRTGEITVANSGLHMWEEPPISGTNGSGAVFFTGCSLRCRFCQNYEISIGNNQGKIFSPEELSDLFFELIDEGAHNINLVTPTHYADKIAKALAYKKLPVPVIYNCGGYENVETLKSLEGLVDIYLPDFKYAQNDLADKLSKTSDYKEVAINAIGEMLRQQPENVFDHGLMKKGVIIRHLILPLHTKNSIEVLNLIKENFGDVLVSLMGQYTPVRNFPDMEEMNRGITKRELLKVQDVMFELQIDGFTQGIKSKGSKYIPNFSKYAN